MTCIGNSGPLSEPVAEAIEKVSQVTLAKRKYPFIYFVGTSTGLLRDFKVATRRIHRTGF